jgi:hypothetical protein
MVVEYSASAFRKKIINKVKFPMFKHINQCEDTFLKAMTWRTPSYGMQRNVVCYKFTDVSEERSAPNVSNVSSSNISVCVTPQIS